MLFVGTILTAAGYTLLYAAVKGDSYTVGGVPVWRRPWLPFVDIFSGRALTAGRGPTSDSSQAPGAALAAAFSGAPTSSPSPLAGQPTAGLGPVTPQSSAGIPPGTIIT